MQLLMADINESELAEEASSLLDILLKDQTTKKEIVWASPSYEGWGKEFCADSRIKLKQIVGPYESIIQPRSVKNKRAQELRTRKRAEVFTPCWIVDKQVQVVEREVGSLDLPAYINLRWLELACGEAPYIVTRYDSITGEMIPVKERVGFLDRKLQRIVKEISTEKEFVKWAKLAYKASYGYELQGDSLLLARENLLLTFYEYYTDTFGIEPDIRVGKEIARIISYNVVQMDGLTGCIPHSAPKVASKGGNLFEEAPEIVSYTDRWAEIKDWRTNKRITVNDISEGDVDMKFDVVIGNPPYQEEAQGNSTKDMPIYHKFLDSAFEIGKCACLITPARFLFNAGATPKQWNKDILSNKHVKNIYYEQDSGKVFPGTDIKGGIGITYFDRSKNYGAIETFTSFSELKSIMKKVNTSSENSLAEIVTNRGSYRYSDLIYEECPSSMKNVSDRRIASNAFEKLSSLFYADLPQDGHEYVKLIGRFNNERVYRWFRRDYMNEPDNFAGYKIIIPKANGSGAIGEVLSTPLIGEPLIGYTETFISVGAFSNEAEATACMKYICGKFSRALLGILKITQDNTKETWRKVPLQDFTVNSDIDWSQPIPDIDRQLYAKYKLSQEEIDFIEEKVRAMD